MEALKDDIIKAINNYNNQNFPQAKIKFILLYGSTAKYLNGIRSNFADIDVQIFYSKDSLKIYGKKILTQCIPKSYIDIFDGKKVKFDIMRSTINANTIKELILEINGKISKRWQGITKFPYVILFPEIYNHFVDLLQNFTPVDYTNFDEYKKYKMEHPGYRFGFHTIYDENAKKVIMWPESYNSPFIVPTFKTKK